MDDITRKWVERAKYDLDTADAMFSGKLYLYVAFMCQQALEKMMKAIIISQNGEVLKAAKVSSLLEPIPAVPEDIKRSDKRTFLGQILKHAKVYNFS